MATKKTKKTRLTNLIIVDASGSMGSKVDEVKGGLKQLFTKIKEDAVKDKSLVIPTTIVIDFASSGDFNVLVNSSEPSELTDALADGYRTRGMTALYDAIGKGFNLIGKKEDNVFVNIITDGAENDSKEFTAKLIKALVKDAKDKKWAVTFMGTTEQSITEAESWGISRGNTMSFSDDRAGVSKSMMKVNSLRSAYHDYSVQHSSVNLDMMMEESEKYDEPVKSEPKSKEKAPEKTT